MATVPPEPGTSIQDETGIKPGWAAESFADLDDDVRQSIARIKASPFVPHTEAVRGFVYDVRTGKLPRGLTAHLGRIVCGQPVRFCLAVRLGRSYRDKLVQ